MSSLHSDLVLRGKRLGAVSGAAIRENEDVELAPRRAVLFTCSMGHEFDVAFAEDAELPDTWECRRHGVNSKRVGAASERKKIKPPRTHWDMLLERRSLAELEALLDERLDELRQHGRAASRE